jgi:hypothetical protein
MSEKKKPPLTLLAFLVQFRTTLQRRIFSGMAWLQQRASYLRRRLLHRMDALELYIWVKMYQTLPFSIPAKPVVKVSDSKDQRCLRELLEREGAIPGATYELAEGGAIKADWNWMCEAASRTSGLSRTFERALDRIPSSDQLLLMAFSSIGSSIRISGERRERLSGKSSLGALALLARALKQKPEAETLAQLYSKVQKGTATLREVAVLEATELSVNRGLSITMAITSLDKSRSTDVMWLVALQRIVGAEISQRRISKLPNPSSPREELLRQVAMMALGTQDLVVPDVTEPTAVDNVLLGILRKQLVNSDLNVLRDSPDTDTLLLYVLLKTRFLSCASDEPDVASRLRSHLGGADAELRAKLLVALRVMGGSSAHDDELKKDIERRLRSSQAVKPGMLCYHLGKLGAMTCTRTQSFTLEDISRMQADWMSMRAELFDALVKKASEPLELFSLTLAFWVSTFGPVPLPDSRLISQVRNLRVAKIEDAGRVSVMGYMLDILDSEEVNSLLLVEAEAKTSSNDLVSLALNRPPKLGILPLTNFLSCSARNPVLLAAVMKEASSTPSRKAKGLSAQMRLTGVVTPATLDFASKLLKNPKALSPDEFRLVDDVFGTRPWEKECRGTKLVAVGYPRGVLPPFHVLGTSVTSSRLKDRKEWNLDDAEEVVALGLVQGLGALSELGTEHTFDTPETYALVAMFFESVLHTPPPPGPAMDVQSGPLQFWVSQKALPSISDVSKTVDPVALTLAYTNFFQVVPSSAVREELDRRLRSLLYSNREGDNTKVYVCLLKLGVHFVNLRGAFRIFGQVDSTRATSWEWMLGQILSEEPEVPKTPFTPESEEVPKTPLTPEPELIPETSQESSELAEIMARPGSQTFASQYMAAKTDSSRTEVLANFYIAGVLQKTSKTEVTERSKARSEQEKRRYWTGRTKVALDKISAIPVALSGSIRTKALLSVVSAIFDDLASHPISISDLPDPGFFLPPSTVDRLTALDDSTRERIADEVTIMYKDPDSLAHLLYRIPDGAREYVYALGLPTYLPYDPSADFCVCGPSDPANKLLYSLFVQSTHLEFIVSALRTVISTLERKGSSLLYILTERPDLVRMFPIVHVRRDAHTDFYVDGKQASSAVGPEFIRIEVVELDPAKFIGQDREDLSFLLNPFMSARAQARPLVFQ